MIDAKMVAELRAQTGAGIVDTKKALVEANGDMVKAAELLRKSGAAKAGGKAERATKEGLVHSYIHPNNKVGVLVEVQCETDFVARTEQFQNLVHDIALQIAATNPTYISPDQIPAQIVAKERDIVMAEFAGSSKPQEVIEKIASGKLEKYYADVCLLNQAFIKDEDMTIGTMIKEAIGKIGENIQVKRFVRFAMSD